MTSPHSGAPLLRVEELVKSYPIRKGLFHLRPKVFTAVDHVSFQIHPGETLGIVGESGSGKTTTARAALYLEKPTSGRVHFEDKDLGSLHGTRLRQLRKRMQMVFQDPFESLNARMTVSEILEEPFIIHRCASSTARRQAVVDLLDRVSIPRSALDKYPHEFSGGQRQRIGIARAIALDPKLVVCDEPVSSLDVSIQGQILNLLIDLQRQMGMAYLFISHDLSVVKHVSDRVAVMYRGAIVETATAEALYRNPLHPYTRMLIDAIPGIDTRRRLGTSPVPDPFGGDPLQGCRFSPRCPIRKEECLQLRPKLVPVSACEDPQHCVACLHHGHFSS